MQVLIYSRYMIYFLIESWENHKVTIYVHAREMISNFIAVKSPELLIKHNYVVKALSSH